MINKIVKIVLFSFIILLSSYESSATHMVGGDFSYRCLGDGYFEVTLTIRRDCDFGAADAQFDEKAIVSVFNQYGQILKRVGLRGGFYLPYEGNDTLNESLKKPCGVLGDFVCVHEAVYKDTIYLPEPLEGEEFVLVYQRCCRNQSLLNINSPVETGGTYVLEIDLKAYNECKQSPVFKEWPAVYVCGGQPLEFDHSATQIDGDSLVYELYTPYSGATINYPRPTTENPGNYTPFYAPISWIGANGYSLDNVLGGADPLKIDPQTGIITGTPETVGQFLVGVLVKQYRDGALFSTVRRDFEYNVRQCVDPPVASFESVDAICGSDITDTLQLINTSQFANTYNWSIYTHSTGQTFTSTNIDVDFIYTLPASGKDTIDIVLDAYSEIADCSDITTKSIIVIDDYLVADFDVEINDCYNDSLDITLNLEDKFDILNPKYTWKDSKWTLIFSDDTLYASGKIVTLIVPKEKKARVILEIETEEKCEASVEKIINLEFADIEFIANPLIVCKGDQEKIIKYPNSNWTYTWVPEDGLDFGSNPNDKSDPTFVGLEDTKYYVTVTDGICTDIDSLDVIVKDYFDISIEGQDTVCTDSIELTAVGGDLLDTVIVYQWSDNSTFTNILDEGRIVKLKIDGKETTFYLRVKEGTGCSNNIDSITVYSGAVDLDYDKEVLYCTNSNSRIKIINLDQFSDVTIHWEDNPIIVEGQDVIISGGDSAYLVIYTETVGEYELIFHATTEFGCELTDTILVIASEGPVLEITNDIECGTYTMCFGVIPSDGTWSLGPYNWDFGDLTTTDDVSSDSNPCYPYPGPGVYKVTVEVKIEECGGTAYLQKEIIVPEILDITLPDDKQVYCQGDEITLIISKNTETEKVEWFDSEVLLGVGDTLRFYPVGDIEVYVVGTDSYECTDTAWISLEEYKYDISYIDPGVRCKGDTVDLEIRINNNANLSFEWIGDNIISGGNTNSPKVVVFEDTDFEVIITDLDYGCDSTFVVSVDVSEIDVYIEADTIELVITNPTNITVYNVPDNSTIEWSTGESNVEVITIIPTAEQTGTVTYCVTVTDEYGCTDVDCVDITVIDPACDESDIYVPNAFSPNYDGNNDVFRARGKYIREVDLEIYDRWGELLFKESGDENISWDGLYKGQELPPDSYTYRIHVLCDDTDNWESVNNVSIIK